MNAKEKGQVETYLGSKFTLKTSARFVIVGLNHNMSDKYN
jgi:hypothetical protein